MEHCELCGSQVEIMGKTNKWYRNIDIERSSELLEETVKLKEQLKEAEKVIKEYARFVVTFGGGKFEEKYLKNKEEE